MCLRALRNIDHATIRVFLRLSNSGGRTQYTWDAYVCNDESSPKPDLVILSQPEHGALSPPPAPLPVMVLKHAQQPAPHWPHHALTRPLQFEEFIDVLQAIESTLQSPPPTPATVDYHDAHLQYKLTAWPSSSILTRHPQFSRLAAFLRSRFLGLDELMRTSRCDERTVLLFLSTLHDLHLLQVQHQVIPTSAPIQTLVSTPPAGRILGVIERLRRKMGLGGTS